MKVNKQHFQEFQNYCLEILFGKTGLKLWWYHREHYKFIES